MADGTAAPTPPSRPADLRQGVWVLVTCFVGLATCITTIVNYTVGALTPMLQSDLGWSRASAAALVTITGIVAGTAGIGAGMLIDRFSLRRVLLVSLPAMAVVELAIALALRAHAGPGVVQLLYGLAAAVGAGGGVVAYSRAIVGRFTSARGLALGITGLSTGIMGIVLPPVVVTLAGSIGVSGVHIVFAVLMLFPLIGVVTVLRPRAAAGPDSREEPAATGRARFAGLRTRAFWQLFVMFAFVGMVASTLFAHAAPAIVDRGESKLVAAGVISALGFGALAGRLVSGWLLDLFPPQRVAFGLLLLATPALPALVWGPIGLTVPAAVLAGLAIGGEADFLGYYMSRRFEPTNLTFLMSLVFFGLTVLGAPAPYVAGLVFDAVGNYHVVAPAVVLLTLAAAVLALALPRVTRPSGPVAGNAAPAAGLDATAAP